MKKSFLVILIMTSIILLPGCETRNHGKPNILLVTCSSLRHDHLAPYGYVLLETPQISSLAQDGTLFEKAYVPSPVILPSQVSIMTGRYPHAHGVRSNLGSYNSNGTLAEAFKKKGYKTSGFVSASLLGAQSGINRGFDFFEDSFIKGMPALYEPFNERIAAYTTNKAVKWLKENSSPFFMWVHYFDASEEYFPPMDLLPLGRDPYDGEVAFIDQEFGRLTATLKEKGIYDNTIIVFTSDSGDPLDQHGEPFQGLFLHDSSLRVPLIIKQKSSDKMKVDRAANPVSTLDIYPTLMELAGIDYEKADGVSIKPLLEASGTTAERALYFENFQPEKAYGWKAVHGVLKNNWKYFSLGPGMLFDHNKDPRENNNLASSEPARLEEMKKYLDEFLSTNNVTEKTPLDVTGFYRIAVDREKTAFTPSSDLTADEMSLFAGKIRSARRKMINGDTNEALRIFEELNTEDPNNPTVLYYLSVMSFTMNFMDRSFDILNEALSIDDQNFVTWTNLGSYYLMKEDSRKALACFSASQILKPECHLAYYNLAGVHFQLNDMAEAEKNLLKAIELNEKDSNSHFKLARVHEKNGNKGKALEHYILAKDYWTGGEAFLDTVNARIATMDKAVGKEKK